jgi:hypothetical protein
MVRRILLVACRIISVHLASVCESLHQHPMQRPHHCCWTACSLAPITPTQLVSPDDPAGQKVYPSAAIFASMDMLFATYRWNDVLAFLRPSPASAASRHVRSAFTRDLRSIDLCRIRFMRHFRCIEQYIPRGGLSYTHTLYVST